MLLPRAAALLTATSRPAARSPLVRLVHTERRLAELGLTLPPPGGPKANYNVACFESPTLLYVSGHLPITLDGMITGSVGPGGLTLEQGQEAARWCGLNLISTIQDQLGGDLDRVEKVRPVTTTPTPPVPTRQSKHTDACQAPLSSALTCGARGGVDRQALWHRLVEARFHGAAPVCRSQPGRPRGCARLI